MRFVLVALVLAVPAVASAQSVARCEIHVLRAPDAVRSAIDEAVRAEKQCATSLVVRVVPTDKGLYVFAEASTGTTFEVVARDAKTAAQHVAHWSVPARAPLAPAVGEPLPVLPNDPLATRARSPDPAPVRTAESVAAVVEPDRRGPWLSIGGVGAPDVQGARLELDLVERSGWSFGFGLEASQMHTAFTSANTMTPPASLDFQDVRAIATVGYTAGRGAWQLRTQLGLGMIRSELAGSVQPMGDVSMSGMFPTGEAALQLTRTLGDSWAFTAGPLLTVYSQEYRMQSTDAMVAKRDFDIAVFGGLRRRL
jgi:hypothetical protein